MQELCFPGELHERGSGMSVEISGISITEATRADPNSPGPRDQLMESWIEINGKRLHLWQIEVDGSRGTTRTYRDKEEMRARSHYLAAETLDRG